MRRHADTAEPGDLPLVASNAAARIDVACRLAAAGKQAARDIAAWLHGFPVAEPEFRLLWLLLQQATTGADETVLDQVELADRLAVSPAQVSGAVERLRTLELVEQVDDRRDRRRRLWRLTASGRQLLASVVSSVRARDAKRDDRIPPLTSSCEGEGLLEGVA